MNEPLIITVAPNGARKTRSDHPALPIAPEELAATAASCLAAGASMMHLHVRDDDEGHSLDVARYRAAIAAIRDRVGQDMIIQVTSEAVGKYSAQQQMQMVRELRPEAVSLAVRELCPEGADEAAAEQFFHWLASERIAPQYILYSPEDIQRFESLRQRGIIPSEHVTVLYVLGRYSASGQSSPDDLLPMLGAAPQGLLWSVCAFGASELDCMLAASEAGGHCRVGFENNLLNSAGHVARDNAELVAQVANVSPRRVASADEARVLLGMN